MNGWASGEDMVDAVTDDIGDVSDREFTNPPRLLGARRSFDRPVHVKHDGVVFQTTCAVLYKFGASEIWIPMSITTEDGERVTMPEWMAMKNGLKAEGGR